MLAHLDADLRAFQLDTSVLHELDATRRFVAPDGSRMPVLMGRYNVPHFDGRGEADGLFLRRGLPVTLLLTSFYWENLIHFGMHPQRGADGKLSFVLPMDDAPLPGIAGEHPSVAQMASALARSANRCSTSRCRVRTTCGSASPARTTWRTCSGSSATSTPSSAPRATSPTREHFIPRFGQPHADLYCVDGRPLEETILGMQVDTAATAGEAVLLTAVQNRYLLNTHRGGGFLNMRLAHEEAAELPGLGRASDEALPLDAVRASTLWPAMREGLKLYGIDEGSLVCVRAFRCSLVHRPRFVAEVARGTWGCLLGDAANALHFWPGRGLNTGLKSALSLARCLARRRGERLRAADLVEHEGVMQMLQAREVGIRSWQTMLMRDADGAPAPIDVRTRRGLQGPCDRTALTRELLTRELLTRLRRMRTRLAHRTGALPDDRLLAARLAALDERTLKVLVETGPWISAEVGGPEVDVASLLPLPAERRAAETPLPHQWGRVGARAISRTPARAPAVQSNVFGNRSIRSHASA